MVCGIELFILILDSFEGGYQEGWCIVENDGWAIFLQQNRRMNGQEE